MIGKMVRDRRLRLNLTQKQVASQAGVTPEWLSVLERDGIEQPGWDRIKAISRVLGFAPEELLHAAGYEVQLPPAEDKSPEQLLLAAEQILVEVRKLLRIRQSEERPEPIRRMRKASVKPRAKTISRRVVRDEQKRLEDQNRDESASGGWALAVALEPAGAA